MKDDIEKLVRVLEDIRENQKLPLELQAEALALHRERLAMVQKQAERTERIRDRAEQIQAASAQLVGGACRAIAFVLPVVLVLVIYLSWLIFRRMVF